MQAHSPAALVAALEFYVEAGIDCALAEEPQDRFAPLPAPRPAPAAERSPPAVAPSAGLLPNAAASPEEVAANARALAREAASLADLERLLAAFDGCALKVSAKTLVFADGDPGGRVMIVGEAPGADEDRMGKPFVGRAGQLLDRMLAAIGLDRNQVYIANLVPWRPPGNRTPTPQEAAICRPFLDRQIELADPDFLVCLGAPATQALLATKDGILRARGRWFPYQTGRREIRGLAMLHPAYLLRQPAQKRLAWRDLQALRRALDGRE
jgi:uracil-DNA glycosylase